MEKNILYLLNEKTDFTLSSEIVVVVVQCLPPDEGLAARRIPLQRSRSSVDLAALVIVSPVHSMMSSVQRLRCRPRTTSFSWCTFLDYFFFQTFVGPTFLSRVYNNPVSMISRDPIALFRRPTLQESIHLSRVVSTGFSGAF